MAVANTKSLGFKSFAPVSVCPVFGVAILRNRDADNCYLIVVFSSQLGLSEPKVSGVSLNHDPDYTFYVAPSSYHTRWDQEGYQFPDTDALPLMR